MAITTNSPPPAGTSSSSSSSSNAYGIDVDAFLAPDFDLIRWINRTLATPPQPTTVNIPSVPLRKGTSNGLLTTTDDPAQPSTPPPLSRHESAELVSDGAELTARARQGSLLGAGVGVNQATSVDQIASGLVLKLQLVSLDISNKFEQLSEEAVRNMPRALYDLELIRKDAQKVNDAISEGSHGFHQAEIGTDGGDAFKDLVKLDLVRSRMVATRLSLKEAENWSTLAGEMNAIFSAEDFEKASVRLDEAQRSLLLLTATPDFADRQSLLAELQTKLQTSIEPRLVAVLNDHDAEAARKLYRVFSRIQRSAEFVKQYETTCTAPLLRLWRDYDEATMVHSAKAGNDGEFAQWLTLFFEEVMRILNKELSWCTYVFPDPLKIIHDLVRHLFGSLQPTFSARVSALAERLGDAALLTIVKAYQSTLQFGIKFERLLFFTDVAHLPSSPTRSARKLDTLQPDSLELNPLSVPDDLTDWGNLAFDAFSGFQQRYGQLELNYLLFLSSAQLKLGRNSDYAEITRLMSESVTKIWSFGEGATSRCRLFTTGFGTADLISTLDEYLVSVFTRYGALLLNLRAGLGLARPEDDAMHPDDPGNGHDLGTRDLGRQEWGNFQVGLKVLGLCHALTQRLESFDRLVRRAMTTVVGRRLEANWNTPTEFWAEDRRSVTSSSSSPSQQGQGEECFASFSVLRDSTLNSYKLRSVFEAMTSGNVTAPATVTVTTPSGASGEPSSNIQVNVDYNPLLKRAPAALRTFVQSAQQLAFDTLFVVVENQLSIVPTLSTWSSAVSTTAGPFNLDVPQFSLSPLPYVTRIGEHLLTLPQQLELYVDDEALRFSTDTLPFLEKGKHHTTDTTTTTTGNGDAERSQEASDEEGEEVEEEEEDVTYLWIKSISRGTMSRFVDTVLDHLVSRLAPDGANQLATDMRYLANVFDAMDVDRDPRFETLLNLLEGHDDNDHGHGDRDRDVVERFRRLTASS
ncbi:hypothetical protein HKX48_006218 [Thoreauomyces humboldtii]|nr:hypothetical protein HKX48_006218 [Thoreauomyces humboldtii]